MDWRGQKETGGDMRRHEGARRRQVRTGGDRRRDEEKEQTRGERSGLEETGVT